MQATMAVTQLKTICTMALKIFKFSKLSEMTKQLKSGENKALISNCLGV